MKTIAALLAMAGFLAGCVVVPPGHGRSHPPGRAYAPPGPPVHYAPAPRFHDPRRWH